jgi:hypothetical protein
MLPSNFFKNIRDEHKQRKISDLWYGHLIMVKQILKEADICLENKNIDEFIKHLDFIVKITSDFINIVISLKEIYEEKNRIAFN